MQDFVSLLFKFGFYNIPTLSLFFFFCFRKRLGDKIAKAEEILNNDSNSNNWHNHFLNKPSGIIIVTIVWLIAILLYGLYYPFSNNLASNW